MKTKPSGKYLHLSGISIEFADNGTMYDIHDLKLQIRCTIPCAIQSSIPLTKSEMAKLGKALILIQQRLNTAAEIPGDILED